jgi:cytosine/adenosine deaminase-related metal-dependent hydrolase
MPWVTTMLGLRREAGDPDPAAISAAIHDAHATGTVAFADIGNTCTALDPLRQAGLDAWHFHELVGFRGGTGPARATAAWRDADVRSGIGGVRCGVAPHAPYSTAPDLIASIAAGLDAAPNRRASVHLGETPEEVQLLAEGVGPWHEMLDAMGVWDPDWRVPHSSPTVYLDGLAALHPRMLIVHGTQFTPDDLARVAARGATLVLCPRSNAWVGVGAPPVEQAWVTGVRVAVGTDSLASVADLDMFKELEALHALAPAVPPAWLLRAATRGGAEALGFSHLGAIEAGRSARLLVVDVPDRVNDVEAWLVSGGVRTADRSWLDARLS